MLTFGFGVRLEFHLCSSASSAFICGLQFFLSAGSSCQMPALTHRLQSLGRQQASGGSFWIAAWHFGGGRDDSDCASGAAARSGQCIRRPAAAAAARRRLAERGEAADRGRSARQGRAGRLLGDLVWPVRPRNSRSSIAIPQALPRCGRAGGRADVGERRGRPDM